MSLGSFQLTLWRPLATRVVSRADVHRERDRIIGQIIDDKYRIVKQIGLGGMGAVYLAVHEGTGRLVALKVITPS